MNSPSKPVDKFIDFARATATPRQLRGCSCAMFAVFLLAMIEITLNADAIYAQVMAGGCVIVFFWGLWMIATRGARSFGRHRS